MRLKLTLYRLGAFQMLIYLVSMKKALLTYERQKGLYQSKVTSSLNFTQRQGHQAHNCKMVYKAFRVLFAWFIGATNHTNVWYRAFSLTWQVATQIYWNKESVYIRKEFKSHRTGSVHQHGRCFYGRHDVM